MANELRCFQISYYQSVKSTNISQSFIRHCRRYYNFRNMFKSLNQIKNSNNLQNPEILELEVTKIVSTQSVSFD